MKKTISIILLASVAMCLSACHRTAEVSEAAPTPVPTASQDELAILAASDTDAATSVQSHVPPASPTDLQIDGAAYEAALTCVDKTIFDLYVAIGQPAQTPVYAPSAVQENAQEGTLVYTGFTVRTLRTDTEEIVQQVDLNIAGAGQSADQSAALPADQSAAQPTDQPAGG